MRTGFGLAGAAVAAIGASVCCVGPLVLVLVGVGGAWVASLTAFEALRPAFTLLALGLIGYTGFELHRGPVACEAGKPCAEPRSRRRRIALFWLTTLPLLALLSFPVYAPLFY